MYDKKTIHIKTIPAKLERESDRQRQRQREHWTLRIKWINKQNHSNTQTQSNPQRPFKSLNKLPTEENTDIESDVIK